MLKTITLKKAVVFMMAVLVVAQAVRPDRTNPPVDPARTLVASVPVPPAIASNLVRACGDCHSSETAWPWYTNVSPLSWWVANHVREGRREVNFSTWADLDVWRKARKLSDICEQVEEKDMPLPSYLLAHREAALSDAERQGICDWTKAEIARMGPLPPEPPGRGRGRGRERG